MNVAILTTLQNLDSKYSVATIVKSQVKMLATAGHNVHLLTIDSFQTDEVLPCVAHSVIPTLPLVDYSAIDEVSGEFDEQVGKVNKALCAFFKENDIDVVITHDWIFIGWFLPHNAAMRQVAVNCPNVKWLHWIHSGPSQRIQGLQGPRQLLQKTMLNSKLVFLNYTDVPRLAKMYDCSEQDIEVVYNPIDVADLWNFSEETRYILEKVDCTSTDVLVVFPASLSPGKQHSKAIKVVAGLKEAGMSVHLLFCNSWSNCDEANNYIWQMKELATVWELEEDEVVFTSTLHKDLELGVARRTVTELLQLSNLFILPSLSEACSMVLLEAAAAGNLLLLNEDFPAMREFGRSDCLYGKFSSVIFKTTYHDERGYFAGLAQEIQHKLQQSPLSMKRRILREFSSESIYKNQLEPILRGCG